MTLSGIIGDGGAAKSITKNSSTLTLFLTNANTYSGGTNINDGVVRATASGALGTGTVFIAGNTANPRLELTGNITLANAITFNGRSSTTTSGIQNISGNNTLSGLIDLQSGGTRTTRFSPMQVC